MSRLTDTKPAPVPGSGAPLRLFSSDHQLDERVLPLRDVTIKSNQLLRNQLTKQVTLPEIRAAMQVERNRPVAFREYDQIPMRRADLLQQVKLIAPYLEGKKVAFIGDNDGTALLLGLLSFHGTPCPARMMVLDFDERILAANERLARRFGFAHLLEVYRYNVFDQLPRSLHGRYDWFYTNPPFGSNNTGASARLFVTRGFELVDPTDSQGCIILPDDADRPWTRSAMLETQRFLIENSWSVREKIDYLHQYHLDDDSDLASCLMIVQHVPHDQHTDEAMLYAGRSVGFSEIPMFYGRGVEPPYPRYISRHGIADRAWPNSREANRS